MHAAIPIKSINQSVDQSINYYYNYYYYRASICEDGLGSRNSVCLSVCPSATRVDCDKTKWRTADILIPHERAITSLCYSDTKSGWWATPPSFWNLRSKWPTPFEKRRLRQISAYNVSTVKDSEKSLIVTNIKSTTGFPRSYRCPYPKSSKGWVKERFFCFFWVKVNGWSSQALST